MKVNINKFVVYQHSNAVTGEIFYIGVGNIDRAFDHKGDGRNNLWHKYVQEAGGEYEVDILHTLDTKEAVEHQERLLIRELRPCCNVDHNPEASLKISEASKTAQLDNARKNGAIAAARTSKAVVNVTTGEVYESAVEASRVLGISGVNLSLHLRGLRKTCGGHVWKFVNPQDATTGHGMQEQRVVQVLTNTSFKSAAEAARAINGNKGHISAVCRGERKTASGSSWVLEDDYIGDAEPYEAKEVTYDEGVKSNPRTSVVCIEKGEEGTIYESAYAAGVDLGIHASSISNQLKGKVKTAGGHTFAYI